MGRRYEDWQVNQALNANVFLYRHILDKNIERELSAVRAKQWRHLPVVLMIKESPKILYQAQQYWFKGLLIQSSKLINTKYPTVKILKRLLLKLIIPPVSHSTQSNEAQLMRIEVFSQIAGIKENLFSEEAVLAIYQSSDGLPRKINNLAKGSLIASAKEKAQMVSAEHVRIASTEIL